jgi:hypothetical protein
LLRRAQQNHPADFRVNDELGTLLEEVPPDFGEAVRFLTAAVALRTESPGDHLNLGEAQKRKGQVDEAIACFNRVNWPASARPRRSPTYRLRSAPFARSSGPRWRRYCRMPRLWPK